MKEYVVRKKVTIRAKPAEVWDALTNPEKTRKYFFRCRVLSDWKEGSAITFRGRMFLFFKIELSGTILKIEPEKLLQYNLRNKSSKGHSAGRSTITDELSFVNGKTTLSITDDVGKGEGATRRYKRSVKGWAKVLKGLKKLLEGTR